MPGGGRRYRLDVPGKLGWLARYLKEVDASETAVRFWQEIYDGTRSHEPVNTPEGLTTREGLNLAVRTRPSVVLSLVR